MKMYDIKWELLEDENNTRLVLTGYFNSVKYSIGKKLKLAPSKQDIRRAKRILVDIFRRTEKELK